MVENKKVMAENIKKYMAYNRVLASDICRTLHIKQNTFSDWINAKTYPRIDKIEMLAEYFGVSKADLVEGAQEHSAVSTEEDAILNAYRRADEGTKTAVCKLLDVVREV